VRRAYVGAVAAWTWSESRREWGAKHYRWRLASAMNAACLAKTVHTDEGVGPAGDEIAPQRCSRQLPTVTPRPREAGDAAVDAASPCPRRRARVRSLPTDPSEALDRCCPDQRTAPFASCARRGGGGG